MSQGLAPTVVAHLFEIVSTLPRRGVSVLLVEQFVAQALGVADRAYVLEKGEVTYAGTARDLAADEDFVRGSYLGDVEVEAEATGRRRRWSEAQPAPEDAVPSGLPQVLARALEELSLREGVPVAELVRQALEQNGTARPPVPSHAGDDQHA
jgi:branched-chain amino acid transport system ATP-binding protein